MPKMKTPHGRYVLAQAALERWLTRLIRAAKEVEKIRKTLRYYERLPIPRVERRYRTGAKSPKRNLWTGDKNE